MRKGLFALLTILTGFVPFAVNAATAATIRICDMTGYEKLGGLLSGISDECGACGQCQIRDFFIVGNTITKLILGLSGSIMLLMVIYGGFLWLTSSGNANLVDKGKKVLIGAVIGLIIVFGAYTATQFILGAIGVTNVSEVFSRPFQDNKGKVVAPSNTGTTSETTPALANTCVCEVAINNTAECLAANPASNNTCTDKPPGCECIIKITGTSASQCTVENVVGSFAPSATGKCELK